MASRQADQQATTLTAPTSASRIYIYRHELLGFAVHMGVDVDGHRIGENGVGDSLVATVSPGPHQITSDDSNQATVTIITKPRYNYFVWQDVKVGCLESTHGAPCSVKA